MNRMESMKLGRERGHKADGPEEDFEDRIDKVVLGGGRNIMLRSDSGDISTRGGIIRRQMGHMVCGQPIVVIAQGWPC